MRVYELYEKGSLIDRFNHSSNSKADMYSSNFCVFFGKLKTLKSHSEINWPLAKKEKDSQHHSGFLWALFFLWKCRWQKSSLFPSVDLWFVRSWSRILQFLLGPNWPPWLALCKDVFGYGTYYCLWYGRM